MNPPMRRRLSHPPEPVDPNNPTWVIRFYEWIIGRVEHHDECLDRTNELIVETMAQISANSLASIGVHKSLDERLEEHEQFHRDMDRTAAARNSVWISQGRMIKRLFEYGTGGTVIGFVVWMFNNIL